MKVAGSFPEIAVGCPDVAVDCLQVAQRLLKIAQDCMVVVMLSRNLGFRTQWACRVYTVYMCWGERLKLPFLVTSPELCIFCRPLQRQ